jgi:anaerobic selenocysteine-containing dehydrogenase
MLGTAEDHQSNPLKIAISEFKRRGGRFISINPVRTGYSAIADEWIPIRPGTDGALLLALCHEIVRLGLYDRDFLQRYTNSADLVNQDAESEDFGLMVCDQDGVENNPHRRHSQLWWDTRIDRAVLNHSTGAEPCLEGSYKLADGTPVRPAFALLRERLGEYTPEYAAAITGIPEETIRRLALELGRTAREQRFELPIKWTDSWGNEHESVTGVPVAFHAMRGLAAHSNGFHSIRALSILMTLLGTIDRPGGFRHKAPYPRGTPPVYSRNPTTPEAIKPNTPLAGAPLGFPACPDDLFVDEAGQPVRIDKAFSWEYPLSVHGMMHNVITNAWRGDPYRIDTLMILMANMAWNSTMNTFQVRQMLNDRHLDGRHKIPFIVVCDTFQSEMTAFADLVLPDTTYLERHDVMSLLDRPISDFDGPADSVRVPVVEPKGECKPFQEVLIELAGRLKFPAFMNADGTRKFTGYPDFVVNFETEPGSGQGFLMGWRGKDGDKALVGEPNARQWEMYAKNNCVFQYKLAPEHQYMRNWNRGYHEWAQRMRLRRFADPIIIQVYAAVLQRFRLAARDKGRGKRPPASLKDRIEKYFDPLPFYYAPLEVQATDTKKYPLAAITQRPMAMYHSWDSQNAWLRQIHSHNYLFVNPGTAQAQGISDGAWMWIESQWGRVRCMGRYSEAVEPGTVWTWNGIGKQPGAWGLAPEANEARKGFLLNHLIADELPSASGRISNSDPVTGQAGWYDLRVRIYPAGVDEPKEVFPQFEALSAVPGTGMRPSWLAYFAGKENVE